MKYRSVTSAVVILLLLLAACATREPSPQELQSKRFETKPDQAVVYLYRDRPDFSRVVASLTLDGQGLGSLYPGTYFRLELAPGRHRVAGFAGDSGMFEFTVEAGRLYFVRHTIGSLIGFDRSVFFPVNEAQGRYAVLQYEYLGNH
jgi:hypothetical protein